MDSLIEQIARAAARAVEMGDEREGGRVLDFSEASLSVVEELLEEASAFYQARRKKSGISWPMTSAATYLRSARREFGGRYSWFTQRDNRSWWSENQPSGSP